MQSRWVDRDAKATVDRYAKAGVAPELALRVYTTRLLGGDPLLVLHGGGNTSVKTRARDLVGDDVEVMFIKGTGAAMASVEPAGMPAVRLDMLRKLRALDDLSDDDMVRVQRSSLIDPTAPSPSLELLLHAFIPHAFVDHTHANAVLSLVDQPDGSKLCDEVYDGRAGLVPYVRPGFGLAKASAVTFDKNPKVEALILDKHGIFTFGASARESYERMIEMVTRAEERLKKSRKAVFATAQLPQQVAPGSDVAPLLRGACCLKDHGGEGAHRRMVLEFRASDAILNFVNGNELTRYGAAGVITPDYTIRTKSWPLIVPTPEAGKLNDFHQAARNAVKSYIESYEAYFARHNARSGGGKIMVDPLPRVALVPGLGLFGLGRSAKDARIAADLAEAAVATITDAEAIGPLLLSTGNI
jgi:rhamnose utilization protein RhaD (predicted bifunctional aldolase and dehydrogenase)